MAISDYIATLQKTQTYQAGLISFQEYSFKSSLLGFKITLPNIPHADEDRHIVVMKIRGDQPNIFKILTPENHSINLTSRDADKILFIFIEMRPQPLKVETPAEGYYLGDGHRIRSTLTVTYQIVNAEIFWKAGKDPLAEFESTITDTIKNFFLSITSNYLINRPAELKQSLEQYIQETGVKNVKNIKNYLEESIWKNCEIAGIKLIKVNADVHLSESLREHLQRIHDKLYEEGGAVERKNIDQIVDSDTTTFAPHGLRAVIMHLDMRLLENFYRMKWSDAMSKVIEKLAEKKEEYLRSLEETKITKWTKRIAIAREIGLDEIRIKELEDKLADELMNDIDHSSEKFSDGEYLKKLITISPSSVDKLTQDKKQQNSSGDDERKDL